MRILLVAACVFLSPLLSLAQESDSSTDIEPSVETLGPLTTLVPAPDITPQVEVMPEFPGGSGALSRFLALHIQYPADAVEQEIEGRLVVQFVVCEDGSLCNEQFLNHLGGGCESEVLRVLHTMPAWKPGLVKGKPVKTFFRLPVTFKLEDEVEEETKE